MFETKKLRYYWLLNTDVLFHQRFNRQKQSFFYQQHSYYQQSFVNTQSNQFFYFFTFQFLYFSTFQSFYFFVSPFQQQPHFSSASWYIQMNYQRLFLPNQFHQQSAVMSTTINNIFSFKVKNIGFFDFNSNVI